MEAGTHSIWISEQLQALGHDVIVANVRKLSAISHSDRKSDQLDAEKLARYGRLDPEILRPIAHRTVDCHVRRHPPMPLACLQLPGVGAVVFKYLQPGIDLPRKSFLAPEQRPHTTAA